MLLQLQHMDYQQVIQYSWLVLMFPVHMKVQHSKKYIQNLLVKQTVINSQYKTQAS